jgi:sirohydrochlorin cobaltochelatase
VNRVELSHTALILFGHGTALNADSGATVLQHGAELRRRRIFAHVSEAFWKQDPLLAEVALKVRQPCVFFLPFFISEGYFSEQVIPAALGFEVQDQRIVSRVLPREDQNWVYCRPVGTHAGMTSVLLGRARSIVHEFPFPQLPHTSEITLFIAGHGTEQNPNSRRVVEHQAGLIRRLGLYAAVQAVFMEEEPRISACYELAQTRDIVVVPFFAGEGLHVQEDIPVLLGEPKHLVRDRLRAGQRGWRSPTEKRGKRVWYAASVGSDPEMAEVILARVREAAAWLPA